MAEKKDEKEGKEGKEEKVEDVFLLQSGVSFEKLKELSDFCGGVQEFVQYLGTNQYYSDGMNKKVFLLTLDVDACLLKVGKVLLKAADLKDVLAKELIEKKKAVLDEKERKAFEELLARTQEEVLAVHERALALTEDIRKEYRQKQAV